MLLTSFSLIEIEMSEDQIIWETDFKIIDKDELEKLWDLEDIKDLDQIQTWWNLRDDLIDLWLLDYDNLDEEQKKIFDELADETRNGDLYNEE